ncbi:MAG TPA: sigma-70 family RNA polymerase sigma factor [Solirubrobacteraceae bacterium]|jgi:RNA polymerase sigma factor (sigma-70 family)|nr:sigma-70 family RNA polymerase sigma factor [Solirubrobacteraceae bacterium]
MEASALTHTNAATPALRGPTPLLRLQSDERLIALTRRGQHAAFETLCARYQSRLLSFCRHMLSSREDAEDVLQEVFAAAFNAVLADEREINVRPWLYRIARNRSLNHLRRASAVGVDSMDVHFADHGMSTGDHAIRRESFRELLADVHELPETQRTALLLREIDALSYEQIAQAMETTVPSVKSLLVRARISLAEAAEARKLSCAEVRLELGEVAEGLVKLSAPGRRHVRGCDRCRSFKRQLKENNTALAAIMPVGALLIFKKLLFAKLGSASAGSAHVGAGAGATVGAGAAAAGSAGAGGGIFTLGAGALATKAVAGLAAAAIVSAGAVAADQSSHHRRHHAHAAVASAAIASPAAEPLVVAERSQPAGAVKTHTTSAGLARRAHRHQLMAAAAVKTKAAPPAPVAVAAPSKPVVTPPVEPQVTQVTTESTQLPASATADEPTGAITTPASAPTTTASTPPPPAVTTPVTTTTTVVTTSTTPAPATEATPPSPGGAQTTPGIEAPADADAAGVVPQVQAGPPQEATASTSASATVASTRHSGLHWLSRHGAARR